METQKAIHSVVENIPGICQLKPEQEECLLNILNGDDVVALLPTGFGKSLIYQILPIVSEKLGRPKAGKAIVVIVSPLVALMEDQVNEAEKLGLCAAQLGVHNDKEIMEGNFSIIFGSPESWILNSKWRAMLASPLYQDSLVAVVVDEAHVAYKWGEASKGNSPFRECFSKVGELRSIVKEGTPFLALTASADMQSRQRVTRILHMDKPINITASPNKTNIRLGVCQVSRNNMSCLDWIVVEVKDKGTSMQPILIYCPTMKIVGQVFGYLKAELQSQAWVDGDPEQKIDNILIGMFHSKTLPQNKDRVLSSLRGEGNCRVVVATTALGMGLNFPNVSHIVMFGAPGDLEAIVQQVGRAGRHGQPAHAILYNTGHYFKVDKDVRELLSVFNKTCIRKFLYAHFETEPSHVEPGHQCCTFCHTVCSCTSGTCTEPTPNYEQIADQPVCVTSRQVDEKDRSLIADLLNDYRSNLINSSTHLYTSHVACTGFSIELVDSVLANCEHIFDLSYIINNLPVFHLDHAKKILNIIADVFGDVSVDVQSDLDESSSGPDLYFSNYFDDDDFVDDAQRSHVSTSESDQ